MPRKTTAPDAESADSKSARTRARLLDAAAHVLGRKGFAGTRLVDIAEQAQVQAPAIYYYFPSREDLVEAVVFAGAAAMRAHLEDALAALPPDTPAADRIAAAVAAHLRHELELSDYARAVVRNANQLPEPLARRALVEITAYYEIWRGLVEELRRTGQLRPDISPSIGRHVVLGALNWSVEWWNPDRGPLDEVIAVAQSMVLHALRP
ncbi:TetR/AcrR family transcriptional regulator [Pseudonocardia sp. WMMC193]|uniref:TetR/AcrR family transcriptional regulator n=1 Tax=Pseudonocardia sp. WMMC193 TaxID=2911965 RepID=UPI001F3B992F|nr:TetR/AcrR family transcriptional regulator [Pseudonocardia sp. WMMC193]MCF7548595.1 TetR/AcrR family transcriptional regulator [Pseudonocardia sp. WMMC193]